MRVDFATAANIKPDEAAVYLCKLRYTVETPTNGWVVGRFERDNFGDLYLRGGAGGRDWLFRVNDTGHCITSCTVTLSPADFLEIRQLV